MCAYTVLSWTQLSSEVYSFVESARVRSFWQTLIFAQDVVKKSLFPGRKSLLSKTDIRCESMEYFSIFSPPQTFRSLVFLVGVSYASCSSGRTSISDAIANFSIGNISHTRKVFPLPLKGCRSLTHNSPKYLEWNLM